MEKSKLNKIIKRVVTALVMIPVVIGALYVGFPYLHLAALIFGGLMAWEWSNMIPNKNAVVYAVTYSLCIVSAIVFPSTLGIALLTLGSAFFIWFKAKEEDHRGLLTLGVFYITIGFGSVVWLYNTVGFIDTLWFLLMVWSVDTGGYIFGSTIKGPKLAPKISPNKTWAGLIGGALLSVVVSIIYCKLFSTQDHIVFYAVLGGIIAVVAQIGDLVESHIKRSLNIKDSSNLIPGHGGAFDRVDGLIFAAPLVFLLFKYVVSFGM